MIEYIHKSKFNEQNIRIHMIFNDLNHETNPGKLIDHTQCWFCKQGTLLGKLSTSKDNKYNIIWHCDTCERNKGNLTISKFSVKRHSNKQFNKNMKIKSTPDAELLKKKRLPNQPAKTRERQSTIPENYRKTETPKNTEKTTKKNHVKRTKTRQESKKEKYISYKNKYLFHKPILGDPNSGNIHTSCCTNRCSKCRARLEGKATKLDEVKVNLFWKCPKCDFKENIVVHENELD